MGWHTTDRRERIHNRIEFSSLSKKHMLSEALVICLERLNRDRGKNLNCRFDFFVGQCVPVSVCYPTLIGKANGIKNEIETSKHYVISPSLRQILFVDRHWFF